MDLALEALREDHYFFIELNGEIWDLDPAHWDAYVRATWPDDLKNLPGQKEVQAQLGLERVFYAPFCCYDSAE